MPLVAAGRSTADRPQPALVQAALPSVPEIAAHAEVCWRLAIGARHALAPVLADLAHVQAALDDPDLADHPKRGWGLRREQSLLAEVATLLPAYLGHLHGVDTAWAALEPFDRSGHELDRLCGVDAGAHVVGPLVAMATDGPIHRVAPLPEGVSIPVEIVETLPAGLQATLGACPF